MKLSTYSLFPSSPSLSIVFNMASQILAITPKGKRRLGLFEREFVRRRNGLTENEKLRNFRS
jgi:hypothetical protein